MMSQFTHKVDSLRLRNTRGKLFKTSLGYQGISFAEKEEWLFWQVSSQAYSRRNAGIFNVTMPPQPGSFHPRLCKIPIVVYRVTNIIHINLTASESADANGKQHSLL